MNSRAAQQHEQQFAELNDPSTQFYQEDESWAVAIMRECENATREEILRSIKTPKSDPSPYMSLLAELDRETAFFDWIEVAEPEPNDRSFDRLTAIQRQMQEHPTGQSTDQV